MSGLNFERKRVSLARVKKIVHSIIAFEKKNVVMCIALVLSIVTMFLIPVDQEYLKYIDYKTITCLFCVLAVVCALRDINFFYMLARKVVALFKNARMSVMALVYITFIGSMLIANDMALLTFLPLGYIVLSQTKKEKYMAVTFILQNIAANLGGMLTPFGNPQNLYLYNKFSIPDLQFIQIMLPSFIISVVLITICVIIFVKPEPLSIVDEKVQVNPTKTSIYLVLFALSIIIVFNIIPFWVGLVIIPIALFILDRNALKHVDYALLFTFVFFFIFAGNLARIDAIRDVISKILNSNVLVFSSLSCQFISNVPSAILLSQFTDNYKELLVGVNIGGTGTLIASLASLITFREYTKNNKGQTLKYIVQFSCFNFAFLGILLLSNIIMIKLNIF